MVSSMSVDGLLSHPTYEMEYHNNIFLLFSLTFYLPLFWTIFNLYIHSTVNSVVEWHHFTIIQYIEWQNMLESKIETSVTLTMTFLYNFS
jgi:hypothetical protein